MREFVGMTTGLVLLAVYVANSYLVLDSSAFVTSHGQQKPHELGRLDAHISAREALGHTSPLGRPAAALHEALGVKGLLGFGLGFGLLAATARGLGRGGAGAGPGRVPRRAAEIDVVEKTETKPLPYFETLPPSIVDKATLDKLLSSLPKEQWDDPPEDSYLYTLKCYAETYGPGKATKMGWYDYIYMKVSGPEFFDDGEDIAARKERFRSMSKNGAFPMEFPGPSNVFESGAVLQWRGEEYFAGDQVKTIVSDSRFSKQFIANTAFYREGLKPWQRGLEIGMAHGYFIIGPFVSLGPLRNTPEAATVGLLAGCALIGLVSVGGLLFGTLIKPTLFDRKDDPPASGFQEMINWHALGGIGGAGFAHALITVFGS